MAHHASCNAEVWMLVVWQRLTVEISDEDDFVSLLYTVIFPGVENTFILCLPLYELLSNCKY